MKHANLPIPKLCAHIVRLYRELDGKGQYFSKEEKEKHILKIVEAERKLGGLLS